MFRASYGEFFELRRRLDPTNKFRNELFNKYYHPQESPRNGKPSALEVGESD
jgi:hypothetical protein